LALFCGTISGTTSGTTYELFFLFYPEYSIFLKLEEQLFLLRPCSAACSTSLDKVFLKKQENGFA